MCGLACKNLFQIVNLHGIWKLIRQAFIRIRQKRRFASIAERLNGSSKLFLNVFAICVKDGARFPST